MSDKTILLIEDNRDDEELTIRAFKACNISDQIVIVRDGAEALDYLFGTGLYAGREFNDNAYINTSRPEPTQN